MLTKNFYSFMGAGLSSNNYDFRIYDGSIKNCNYKSSALPFSVMKTPSYSNSETGVCFGTGTTPATVDDYKLESVIDSSKATMRQVIL